MKIISSKDNEIVKHIKKLKDKKYRDENNEYIVDYDNDEVYYTKGIKDADDNLHSRRC